LTHTHVDIFMGEENMGEQMAEKKWDEQDFEKY
jgi:hypothetical protein